MLVFNPISLILTETVSVITNDGRNIVVRQEPFSFFRKTLHYVIYFQGTLRGYDQASNLILEQSHERIFSEDEGVIQNPLGLYIIRGDNV